MPKIVARPMHVRARATGVMPRYPLAASIAAHAAHNGLHHAPRSAESIMKKIAAVLLTAGSLALAGPASAHDRGGVIVGALIGGAVLGAIVMSALNPAPAVAYAAPAYQAPAYRAPAISRRDISRRRLTVRSRGRSL
ncbi:hypothetical protein D0U02_07660 [Burkholderia pseudomallei]|nr:hypothetical protein D0U05_27685 [Burkholderia pseudomallei]RFS60876.1 hypothetical protein D0U01_23800 [Burkholderia pseudomallei]RFS65409.1 hypothetical protein D0U02_07660 [Burkholderia pseudomallei]RFS68019.1 hypothetical protein D0T98_33015 [Burkholderia pseudomallei]